MDRRMDSFAHGGYDGLDGGDRDASAGKKNTKTQKHKDRQQYQLHYNQAGADTTLQDEDGQTAGQVSAVIQCLVSFFWDL